MEIPATIGDVIGAVFVGTLGLSILTVFLGGLAWLATTIWLDLREMWRGRNRFG